MKWDLTESNDAYVLKSFPEWESFPGSTLFALRLKKQSTCMERIGSVLECLTQYCGLHVQASPKQDTLSST